MIIKNRKTNFAQVSNILLNDKRLSWKAKGVMSYIMGLPDGWKLHPRELVSHAKDGRDSMYNALNELIKYGYIKRIIRRNDKGVIIDTDYYCSDEGEYQKLLDTDNPPTDYPDTDYPDTGIADDNNKDNSNKDYNNKEKLKKEIDISLIPDLDNSYIPLITEWIEYKTERKEKYKQTGINKFYKRLIELSGNNKQKAQKIIDQSIACNYSGIFELKDKSQYKALPQRLSYSDFD